MDYLIFSDRAEAERTLAQLNEWTRARWGREWARLIEHPVELRYAVCVDERVNGALAGDLAKVTMSEAEATRLGFYFSPLEGRFYKALHKCDEAEILWQSLADGYGRISFPAARCLFVGVLGALYSVDQNLKMIVTGDAARSLPNYGGLEKWWKDRRDEIHKPGELLYFLRSFNNSDKHGDASVPIGLRPTVRLISSDNQELVLTGSEYMGDATGFRISAHGAFQAKPFAGGYERWVESDEAGIHAFVSCKASFTFEVLGAPTVHLGVPHQAVTPPAILRLAVDYYLELVGNAVLEWERAAGRLPQQ